MRIGNITQIFSIFVLVVFSTGFAQAPLLLDPVAQPKFVNPLPNPLDPGFIFEPTSTAGTHYEVGMYQFQQSLGLVDPLTNTPLLTTVWGYGQNGVGTYPGKTFEIQSHQLVTVQWTNDLVDVNGDPLPHILPIDPTLHWAFSLPGYSWNDYQTYGVPVIPHVHGGHTESQSDGLPEYWFTPGYQKVGPRFQDGRRLDLGEPFHYDNDQQAGTIWYHDHGLGITRLNVYAGLAGFYIIRDGQDTGLESNPLGLPAFPYEIPIVIQDRIFTADGQLFYPSDPALAGVNMPGFDPFTGSVSALPEFFGDFILVNGQAWPLTSVEPRLYRLRILNGSDSRFYNLFLSSGQVIHVIGTDNGLLSVPTPVTQLTIGPGERYDVLLDFTAFAGQTIIMKNNARSPFPKGATVNPRTSGQVMAFQVGTVVSNTANNVIPTTLAGPIIPLVPTTDPVTGLPKTRKLLLFEGMDKYGRLQPLLGIVDPTNPDDGTLLWEDAITENPMLNDTEIWEVYNATMDAHPIHIHLVQFQLLGRQKYSGTILPKANMHGTTGGILTNIKLKGQQKGPDPNEAGWKDTAIMYPGEVTRVIATYDRLGRYVWHCHILSHEDHEMMRPYEVVDIPAVDKGNHLAEGTIGVNVVNQFALEQNYPNPFNPTTEIRFSLAEASNVRLAIFNTLGQEVKSLASGMLDKGAHQVAWDATDNFGNRVASGVYIYRIEAGNFVQQRKMMLLK